FFGLGLHEGLRQMGPLTNRGRAFQSYLLGLCLVQLGLVAYNPRLTVPYRSDQWADEELAQRMAALPGPVFAPNLEGYALAAGIGEQPYPIAGGGLHGDYGGQPTAARTRRG